MFRLHPGELTPDGTQYAYTDATDNVLRYNVSSNMFRMVETEPRLSGTYQFQASPRGNIVSDNVLYSDSLTGQNDSGSYLNNDGMWTELQFRANNTWGFNAVANNDLPASGCGNPTLFNGPGGAGVSISGSPDLLGGLATITAPSWW